MSSRGRVRECLVKNGISGRVRGREKVLRDTAESRGYSSLCVRTSGRLSSKRKPLQSLKGKVLRSLGRTLENGFHVDGED